MDKTNGRIRAILYMERKILCQKKEEKRKKKKVENINE